MRVFISWSGELSKVVGAEVRDWLPLVLQGLDVFMSDVNIDSGTRWFESIGTNLKDSEFGIIVVTRENQVRPWLLFEAGVCPSPWNKPVSFRFWSTFLRPTSFSRCHNSRRAN